MSVFESLGIKSPSDHSKRLEELCETVTRAMRNFREVGDALAEIRDKQLYRNHAKSFEDFCQARWKMTPQHAGRLIAAAGICNELEPMGSIPANERQARALSTLGSDMAKDVWSEVLPSADSRGVVPAKALKDAIAKRRPKKAKKPPVVRITVAGAKVIIEPNKAFHGPEKTLRFAIEKLTQESDAVKAAA